MIANGRDQNQSVRVWVLERLRKSTSSSLHTDPIVTPSLTLVHPLSLCDTSSSDPLVLNAVVGSTFFLDITRFPLSDPAVAASLASLLSTRSLRVIATDGSVHSVASSDLSQHSPV